MTLTLGQRIAIIDADPALSALSEICDLGTCAGPKRGSFQKALDIASNALHTGVERAIAAMPADKDGPTTSAEVASIAGELLNLDAADLVALDCGSGNLSSDDLLAKIKTVAASCLGQRQ